MTTPTDSISPGLIKEDLVIGKGETAALGMRAGEIENLMNQKLERWTALESKG